MSVAAEALRMADDPMGYFHYSMPEAHALPRKDVDEMQLSALQQRFEQLRGPLRVLKSTVDEMGFDRINRLEDGAALLFPQTVYKSYPISLLEKSRFDQLTKWLSRLTTTDLSNVDASKCDGIDSWLQALEEGSGLQVAHSSGTSGTMSFLPRNGTDYKIKAGVFAMTTREFNGLDKPVDMSNEPWHCVFFGFRGGRSELGRSTQWLIDHFAGSKEYLYPLHDADMSSDVMFIAAQVRRAQARGELDRLTITPQMKARQAEFEAIQKNAEHAADRMFAKLMELKGEKRVYFGGMTVNLVELAKKGLERGHRNMFGPGCIVQTGGGAKGLTLPENWEEIVMEFTGAKRIGQFYGMTEVQMVAAKCSEGHYHVPPWVVMYLLDPDTGKVLPREGVVTGRGSFFDLTPQTYWGGFVTGDELTVDWTPCRCGRTTPHIHPNIQRYSEKRGGDDKITCAAAEDAHNAAIDFLANA
jgi:hypothetical protein